MPAQRPFALGGLNHATAKPPNLSQHLAPEFCLPTTTRTWIFVFRQPALCPVGNVVPPVGLEPTRAGLEGRCASCCATGVLSGANGGTRTRSPRLGTAALFQLSHVRKWSALEESNLRQRGKNPVPNH